MDLLPQLLRKLRQEGHSMSNWVKKPCLKVKIKGRRVRVSGQPGQYRRTLSPEREREGRERDSKRLGDIVQWESPWLAQSRLEVQSSIPA